MIELKLAQYGMGMVDGTVIQWLKQEGDAVEENEPLLEVEAAKATMEVPAPCKGVLHKILVRQDETVPVQTVLALIDDGAGG